MTVINCESDKPKKPDALYELKRIEELKKLHGTRMLLEADWKNNTIIIGKMTVHQYANYKGLDVFVSSVLAHNEISDVSHHPKWRMKTASEIFGVAPRTMFKMYKGLQYKMFVVPHIEILTKIAYSPGRINVPALNKIIEHKKILHEVFNDKLYNILPIVAATGLSPKELKKELGQTWKVLCKNSLNKNKAVVGSNNCFKDYGVYGNRVSDIHIRAKLPTTVLETFTGNGYNTNLLIHIAQHYKGKWRPKVKRVSTPLTVPQTIEKLAKMVKVRTDWQQVGYIIRDTERMATQLQAPFDPLWTPRKMKEKHDQYAKDILVLKFSPDKLKILDKIPVQKFSHENYLATLLDSRALIAEEGSAMGHCVAGYAESVASGSYLVYSITKDGERSSTIGINVLSEARYNTQLGGLLFRMNQHYGRFNRQLVCEHEIEIGKLIITELNKEKQYEGNEI